MASVPEGAAAFDRPGPPANGASEASAFKEWLPPLLSVIAGMADLLGFLALGSIFTAHITGNLVLTAAAAVRGAPIQVAQVAAIPVFIAAVAATWAVARAFHKHGPALARRLLGIQFGLLAAVLAICIVAKASANPHSLASGIAAMLAVAAMACQFALLRLALPRVVSTAVMTGNLTNSILALMDFLSKDRLLRRAELERLMASLRLLAGFLLGCIVAAAALSFMADWAWSLPVVLAGLAAAMHK